MKKLVATLLVICLALTPISCLAESKSDINLEDMSMKEIKALNTAIDAVMNGDSVDSDYSYLEDMSVKELKALDAEIDELLGDNTEETEADTTEDNTWEMRYYVDEFNEPTDDAFVTNTGLLEGTFSNSATTNSLLQGFFRIEKDMVSMQLFEYGEYRVTNPYSKLKQFGVTVLDQDKNKKTYYGAMVSDGTVLFLYDTSSLNSCSNFINLLKKGGTIKISIDDYDGSTYLFPDVNCNGFEEAYSELLSVSK